MSLQTFKTFPRTAQITILSLAVLCLVLIISNIMYVRKVHDLRNPAEAVANEIKKLVADISAFIVLPTDEIPTLATVSDPSKLKDQKFFANAEVGDKVLIYPTSQKAILWRPSTKKIVEISSIGK